MIEKKIEFYTTKNGKCPFLEWISDLSLEYRIRVNKRINRMKDGNFGDYKKLQNSQLSELRLDFGKGYRIYFKDLDNIVILIVTASDKSNQKKTIELANSYYDDYLNREYQYDNKI